jgi:hypothetical protein
MKILGDNAGVPSRDDYKGKDGVLADAMQVVHRG